MVGGVGRVPPSPARGTRNVAGGGSAARSPRRGRQAGPNAPSYAKGGRPVKKIINDPNSFVDEALEGLLISHPKSSTSCTGGSARSWTSSGRLYTAPTWGSTRRASRWPAPRYRSWASRTGCATTSTPLPPRPSSRRHERAGSGGDRLRAVSGGLSAGGRGHLRGEPAVVGRRQATPHTSSVPARTTGVPSAARGEALAGVSTCATGMKGC